MPWNYLGIKTNNGIVTGFREHNSSEDYIRDYFSNGFHMLSPKIFDFTPEKTNKGELGLPQTLFAHLDNQPLHAFEFADWQAVNSSEDLSKAIEFIRKFRRHI